MTRVLNILSDSNIGGAGRCLVNYLKYCDRSRFDLGVVLPRGSLLIPEVTALNTPVFEVDGIAERSFSPEAIRALAEIIRREKPDIVHTHGSLSGRIAGRLCGSKVVYTRHSAFPVPQAQKKGPRHWANRAVNSLFADHIIAVSPATAENLIESGAPKKKIVTLPNGVAPLKQVSTPDCDALRRKWGIPEGVFTAGLPARLEPYKGHQLLLEAALELKQEGLDFRILIAGSGSQGAEIRSRIEAMGLSSHVLLLGFVSDMAAFFSILDVQLNCSYESEACSLSIIEGMSLGLPAIASNCSGNPWLVEDSRTGFLFENKNAHDLAEKLRTLMDSPDLLADMRHNSLEAYRSRFTGEIFAKNIEAVYTKTLYGK